MKHSEILVFLLGAVFLAQAQSAREYPIVRSQPPHTVRYDLYVTDTMVNFGHKTKRAIAVNGQT